MPTIVTERYAHLTPAVNDSVFTFSPSSTVAAGTTAFLFYYRVGQSASVADVASVTDSVGNSWGIDVTWEWSVGAAGMQICRSNIVTPITTSDTITLNFTGAINLGRPIYVQEVSGGIVAVNPLDVTAEGTGASGNDATSGLGSTLAQTQEVAWGVMANSNGNAQGFTPGSGWTSATTTSLDSSANASLEYQITSVATPIAATGHYSRGDGAWGSLLATYEVLVPTVVTVPGPPALLGRMGR